ncbi:MAG: hypothetical protein IH594_14715 [Bacteroidales bacterium]|nr:hypothetical protein [Bacteroidales bacterium]
MEARNDKGPLDSRREIGRPPGNLAFEKYAYGRPISLHFTPVLVISKEGPRSANEGGLTEKPPDHKGGSPLLCPKKYNGDFPKRSGGSSLTHFAIAPLARYQMISLSGDHPSSLSFHQMHQRFRLFYCRINLYHPSGVY